MSKKEAWFFSPGEEAFYSVHKGKRLAFKLIDGDIMEAVLLGVDAYHIVLRRRDGVTVLLPKHAILYVLTREELQAGEEGT